ncbi:MAG: rane-bound serine protease (ClpP class) [Actinomycetia bacterium]|nr:rane-bound serine protease (ClpP class) [Actinomycetes bacterium]
MLLAVLVAGLGACLLRTPASAQQTQPRRAGIDVVSVEGFLDPPNATLIERSVRDAQRSNAMLLVFQLHSSGAVDVNVDRLIDAMSRSTVPIAVWVGPTGANARGGAALFALSAPVVSVAQGGGIGPVSPVRLDRSNDVSNAALRSRLAAVQRGYGRSDKLVSDVVTHRVPAQRAADEGLINRASPTVGEFIVSLHGTTVKTAAGPVTLSTARVVGEGKNRRRVPNQVVSFGKLDLAGQVQHTLDTPWVAYFLFVVGGALLVFEFFTVSIGIAGLVGAMAIVAACYGFSHLPVHPYAVGLLILAMIGFAVDVQATALGAWTFIGSASLVAGSLTLYGGSSRLDPVWWVQLIVIVGTIVFMLSGMTAMVRSRFSTPTIGREELIGELGSAEVDVAPDGVVRVRDTLWRARTNRATPIAAGQTVRVVSVEGILLAVEPEEGGAKDYREPRSKRS